MRRARGQIGGPLREDRLPVLEQHEQIRAAVEIDIHDRPHAFVCDQIEFIVEIGSLIEVAVDDAPGDDPVLVVFVCVGGAVEVGVGQRAAKLARRIVEAPEIRPAVSIAILDVDGAIA